MAKKALAPADVKIACARFPTIFAACQKLAAERREPCTRELFAEAVSRYPADQMQIAENRFSAFPADQRDALIRQFGF